MSKLFGEFYFQNKIDGVKGSYSVLLLKTEILEIIQFLKEKDLWKYIFEGDIEIEEDVGIYIEKYILKRHIFDFIKYEIFFGFYDNYRASYHYYYYLISNSNEKVNIISVIPEIIVKRIDFIRNLVLESKVIINEDQMAGISEVYKNNGIFLLNFDKGKFQYSISKSEMINFKIERSIVFNI